MSITQHLAFSRTVLTTILAATLTAGLTGCSDDGGSNNTTSISGSVFASSVRGASCEFQDSLGDTVKGPFVTSSTGTYKVSVPNSALSEDLMLVCTGGAYTDEATGTTNVDAGTMAAYVAGGTLSHGSTVHATPGSTIVYHMVTASNPKTFTTSQERFTEAFGYTPDTSIAPTDATNPDAGATEEQLLAGLRAAAFSQLTSDLSLDEADQSALLEALAKDLFDNELDGDNGSNPTILITGTATNLPVDIQNKFATAFLKFHDNPIIDDGMMDPASNDATGLTADKIGTLPLGGIALTDSYHVEYVEGSMMAAQGKTKFQIFVGSLAGGAVTDASVMLMPMMYMDIKSHSTPVDGSCIHSADGLYDCTVYYVMATMMGGYWDLKVMISGEEAHFYPEVMMAMGDTALAKLRNENVTIPMMGVRTLLLFNDGLTGTPSDHTLGIFTATMETMMDFPAVTPDSVLTGLSVDTMVLEVSNDLGANWVAANHDGNGHWSSEPIDSLSNGTPADLYVRLTINGLTFYSTLDGTVGTDYATFTVTPKASSM